VVPGEGSFGNDYIAGGAGHDELFGQLGHDVIQGDGSSRTRWMPLNTLAQLGALPVRLTPSGRCSW